jgi:hypothetical protein
MNAHRSPVFTSVVLAAAMAACTQTPSTAPTGSPAPTSPAPVTASPAPTAGALATSQPSPSRDDGWRADLAMLVPGMAAIHPDLTHGVSRADLDAAVTNLSASVAGATDDQLMLGVLRIVAMVSAAGCDAHTGAFIWGSGTYPVDSLPLRLWLFPDEAEGEGDEVVVVDALPPYAGLIGSRIDTVEGHAIADVLAAIDPIVPRDNAQTVRLLTPRFLLIPQVLRGLGLADAGSLSVALTSVDGAESTIEVDPIPMADYNAWAGPYGLHLPADPDVPYLSRIDDAMWWTVLADEVDPGQHTLFVQNNRTDDLTAALLGELEAALHEPDVSRVVLDLRHNFGGELRAIPPIQALFEDPAVDQHDHLYVLTGRNTFSGGSLLAARLDRNTEALIVGEAMGGCPTIWSDPSELALPWSGIVVSVADDVAVGVDPNDTRLTIEPDVSAILTREEWADGLDPALEFFEVVAP